MMFYKIVNGDVVVTPDDLDLELADIRTRSNHRHKFTKKILSANRLKFCPVFHTVAMWNKLLAQVAEEAGSINSFKSQLIKIQP